MRVYVVGAGAVGTYLGELLRGIGNEVVYAPRELAAVEPVAADLALVTVKAYDTPGAIETLRRALRDPAATAIVTPQNGVGNEAALAEAFGADNVVAAALTVPVELGPHGRGVAARGGGIAFAPVGGGSAHNWILAAFGATGLPTSAVADHRALKWSKLALNVVANASCAILDMTPERLVRADAAFAPRAARDPRAARHDEGAGDRADRLAALPGARAAGRGRAAGAGRPRDPGQPHRRRAGREAALAAARPARRQAPNRSRSAQRRGRRAPRARPASRRRSTPPSRGWSATSRTCRNSGRSTANAPTPWWPRSTPHHETPQRSRVARRLGDPAPHVPLRPAALGRAGRRTPGSRRARGGGAVRAAGGRPRGRPRPGPAARPQGRPDADPLRAQLRPAGRSAGARSTSWPCATTSSRRTRTSRSSSWGSTPTRRASTPTCATAASSRTPTPGTTPSTRTWRRRRASRATRRGCGRASRRAATSASTR